MLTALGRALVPRIGLAEFLEREAGAVDTRNHNRQADRCVAEKGTP
ncbi:hypothetical protein [uncultured Reyranella sp.]|nr:hypothetical protein [uncultured Reyranella sp.]